MKHFYLELEWSMLQVKRILVTILCFVLSSVVLATTQVNESSLDEKRVEQNQGEFIYLPSEIADEDTSLDEDGSLLIERGAGCPPRGPFGASAAICHGVCKAKGYSGGYCAGKGDKICKCHN